MTTVVRGRITSALRDTNNDGEVEHKLNVRLLPEDGAVGDLTVNVSPTVYEQFAKNFTRVVEVEVRLLFDKPAAT